MAVILKENASCLGKKLGHNFLIAGGTCTRCGISQNELNQPLKKIEYFIKEPAKGIHSEMHALAKEVSEFCGEPKKFGMYLGIIKNIGLPRAYRIFAELKQAKEIETPGKLFLYLSAYRKPAREKNKKLNKNGNRKGTTKNTSQKIKKGQ